MARLMSYIKEIAKLANTFPGTLRSSPGSSSPRRTASWLVPNKRTVIFVVESRCPAR